MGASSFGLSVAPCEVLLSSLRLLSSVLSLSFTLLRSDLVCFSCGCVARRGNLNVSLLDTHLLGHLGHSFTLPLTPRLVFFLLVSLRWLHCGLDGVLLLHFRFLYLDSFFVPSPVTQSVCFTYTHTHSVPCAF